MKVVKQYKTIYQNNLCIPGFVIFQIRLFLTYCIMSFKMYFQYTFQCRTNTKK